MHAPLTTHIEPYAATSGAHEWKSAEALVATINKATSGAASLKDWPKASGTATRAPNSTMVKRIDVPSSQYGSRRSTKVLIRASCPSATITESDGSTRVEKITAICWTTPASCVEREYTPMLDIGTYHFRITRSNQFAPNRPAQLDSSTGAEKRAMLR